MLLPCGCGAGGACADVLAAKIWRIRCACDIGVGEGAVSLQATPWAASGNLSEELKCRRGVDEG